MIQSFVDKFIASQDIIKDKISKKCPGGYKNLVQLAIESLGTEDDSSYNSPLPDPSRIVEIDQGDYQGTLVFVIGEYGYQPITYWYARVNYGSCSGCDTFQAIGGWHEDPLTEEQVNDYYTLTLHIIQQLKMMDDKET